MFFVLGPLELFLVLCSGMKPVSALRIIDVTGDLNWDKWHVKQAPPLPPE